MSAVDGRGSKPVAKRESAHHVPKSTSAMWSATRIACAAMVSAGFTAAEDGKKEASTTNKFSWSKDLQNSFNAAFAGIISKSHSTALMRNREASHVLRNVQPETNFSHQRDGCLREALVPGHVVRCVVKPDLVTLQNHAILGIR